MFHLVHHRDLVCLHYHAASEHSLPDSRVSSRCAPFPFIVSVDSRREDQWLYRNTAGGVFHGYDSRLHLLGQGYRQVRTKEVHGGNLDMYVCIGVMINSQRSLYHTLRLLRQLLAVRRLPLPERTARRHHAHRSSDAHRNLQREESAH